MFRDSRQDRQGSSGTADKDVRRKGQEDRQTDRGIQGQQTRMHRERDRKTDRQGCSGTADKDVQRKGQEDRQTDRGVQGQQTGQTGVFRDSKQGRTEKGTGRQTDRGIQTLSRKETRDEQKEDGEGAACS